MKNNLTKLEKQDLMFAWSRQNAQQLADEVLKIWGKNDQPTENVSYEFFCQIVRNIGLTISQKFDEYNKTEKYTTDLSKYDLTDYDYSIFINTLIWSAALIVTSNTFYTKDS